MIGPILVSILGGLVIFGATCWMWSHWYNRQMKQLDTDIRRMGFLARLAFDTANEIEVSHGEPSVFGEGMYDEVNRIEVRWRL